MYWLKRAALLAFCLLSISVQGGEIRRIAIIHSYHAGLSWTDAVQRGIEQAIAGSGTEISLQIEYLDALRYRNNQLPAIKQQLKASLMAKFAIQAPAAIIVSDNDALDFIIAERDHLAPETPIIFCGINGLNVYPAEQLIGMTGVAEEASFGDTLEVMSTLFPGRQILVIGDRSNTFQGNLASLKTANRLRAQPATLEVFNEPNLRLIEERMKLLDPDTLVFFMARPLDDDGQPLPIERAVRAISTASPQPVFSGWEFALDHGIIGGRLVSGEAQGEAAASLLLKILSGTPPSRLPIISESPNRYRFDYRELQRFGVANRPLPEGASVINRPISFYQANRDEVHATLVAFGVLLAIVFLLLAEILRRRKAEQQLSYIASHDALTGLTNRALLGDRMKQAIIFAKRENRAVACLFLDLDHFKEINDSLGHSMGDQLLTAVAERLAGQVRDTDTICRLGGDEFVILLGNLAQGVDATYMASKITAAMQAPFRIAGSTLNVSFSIGISAFPWDGQDFEALLKNADIAMYQAKSAGRNQYRFFDAAMNAQIQRRAQIHQHLVGAQLRGELSLHLQPQQSLADGSIVGAEALLRWSSPELGNISPAEFIPVAESSGLIVAIGAWVFEEGCRIVAGWQAQEYPPIPLAINVSVAQLRRPEFSAFVASTLTAYQLAPTRIEVEITESVFMEDISTIDGNLQAIREMGILLAVDDFGTGYSNLTNLKRTGAGRLKIDKAFVDHVTSDTNDAAIVRAVIQIGRSLGMKTIAEGVEKQDQADLLSTLGCDALQGYLLSRPVPAKDFDRFFTSYPARHQLTVVDLGSPAKAQRPDDLAEPAVSHPAEQTIR